MKCPKCNGDRTSVVDSRLTASERLIRRRRACLDCRARYTTYEVEARLIDAILNMPNKLPAIARLLQEATQKAVEANDSIQVLVRLGFHAGETTKILPLPGWKQRELNRRKPVGVGAPRGKEDSGSYVEELSRLASADHSDG